MLLYSQRKKSRSENVTWQGCLEGSRGERRSSFPSWSKVFCSTSAPSPGIHLRERKGPGEVSGCNLGMVLQSPSMPRCWGADKSSDREQGIVKPSSHIHSAPRSLQGKRTCQPGVPGKMDCGCQEAKHNELSGNKY